MIGVLHFHDLICSTTAYMVVEVEGVARVLILLIMQVVSEWPRHGYKVTFDLGQGSNFVRNFFANLVFCIFQVVNCVCGPAHIPHLKPPGNCPRPVVSIGNISHIHTRMPLLGNSVLAKQKKSLIDFTCFARRF